MDRKQQRNAPAMPPPKKQVDISSEKNAEKPEKASSVVEETIHTCQLDSRNPFKPSAVTPILKDVLDRGLEEVTYDAAVCSKLCMDLSVEIRSRIKSLNFDRYKLVCVVEIVEKKMQSLRSICSFLWDAQRDNYAVYKHEKYDLFAIAYVFGVYYE